MHPDKERVIGILTSFLLCVLRTDEIEFEGRIAPSSFLGVYFLGMFRDVLGK